MADFATVERVEVFEAGHYPQGDVSEADLDSIVKNFSEFPAKGSTFEPPLKLGHGEDGKKLLTRSGFPAAGAVSKLWREGRKLIASFKDVPRVIAELVNKGAYRNRSAEIKFDPPPVGPRLVGVALLGEERPAVETLQQMLALYAGVEKPICFEAQIQKESPPMPDPNVPANPPAAGDAAKAAEEKAKADAAKLAALEKENADLKAEKEKQAEAIQSLTVTVNELKAKVEPPAGQKQTNGDTGQTEAEKKIAAAAERADKALKVITAGERDVLRRDYAARIGGLVKAGKLAPAVVNAGLEEFALELDRDAVVKFSANAEPMSARLWRLLDAAPVCFKADGAETSTGSAEDGKSADELKAEREKTFKADFAAKGGEALLGCDEARYVAVREARFLTSEKK